MSLQCTGMKDMKSYVDVMVWPKMNILSFGTIGPFGKSEDWITRDARGVQNKRYFECKPSREI